MIAELAVVLIDDPELPLYRGLAPIALLILLQRIFTYLQVKKSKISRSRRWRTSHYY